MKILSTQKFEEKFQILNQEYKNAFLDVLRSVKDLSTDETASILGIKTVFNPNNIQVYKIDNLRIFVNFVKDNQGVDVLVFLDLTLDVAPIISSRNPRINGSINPRINGSINPRINGSINPRINGSINPRINGSINPRINGSINPRINGSINPRINGSINPRINGSINPRINGSINPRINPNFPGFYFYNINTVPVEFVIKENSHNILAFFDFSGEQTKFAVPHTQSGYIVFDLENNWVGHLESDLQNGFNYFDLDNEWIGFLK